MLPFKAKIGDLVTIAGRMEVFRVIGIEKVDVLDEYGNEIDEEFSFICKEVSHGYIEEIVEEEIVYVHKMSPSETSYEEEVEVEKPCKGEYKFNIPYVEEDVNSLLDERNSIELYRDIMQEPEFMNERIKEIDEELAKYSTID